ncbi:acyl carrier protein [Nocardia cyriacigeorgica]|uniref:acyl carrier protein n=1 Tax=Nocardia cyriacigeorgica TaxID=135487 RepID=UPI0013D852B5|nr:acyl carrier protein [Nocardia cyriacigeorgica]MBF6455305.1 acyl carrier protein [Nocardia cyriacigeorgica]MBF6479575.1 acyl carrier protein [Nocardia cyriacigeorgica]MBF6553953.1 acyl carrier protein [Nocardia cyriacigeorgica]NEW29672.1 acyl carrier protein [Nocardia cyriacigeorgica]
MFATATTPPTSITGWLAERVADYTGRAAHQVDPAVPLAELGLDSVSAVALCGEIEDRWSIEVDPTLVFDYPTIADIAAFLAIDTTCAA